MSFFDDFPALDPRAQEQFRLSVTRLLAGDVIGPGSGIAPSASWRFVERHQDLIEEYLRIGGWRLELDPTMRIARAVHLTGEHRVRLNKLESLVMLMLRLIYHERMEEVGDDLRCEVSVGELRERLIHEGKPAHQLSRRALAVALVRLARHSVVELPRGFAGEDREALVVTPLIEKVLPPERIRQYHDRVREYLASDRGGAGEGEEEVGETDAGEAADAPGA
jgi:hypothetical protein